MNKIGRPGRTEPVTQTTTYLTDDAVIASNEIRDLMLKTKNIKITTVSDAINIALVEFSGTLQTQYGEIIKRASGRPIG